MTLIGCGHSNLNLYRPRGRSRLILPSSVLHTTQSDKISASQNFREKVKRQSLQYNGEYNVRIKFAALKKPYLFGTPYKNTSYLVTMSKRGCRGREHQITILQPSKIVTRWGSCSNNATIPFLLFVAFCTDKGKFLGFWDIT